ncbi:MAG: hypothetical protein Q8P08_02465 [bacterium]|nr:hypothetical protein [bacterium]
MSEGNTEAGQVGNPNQAPKEGIRGSLRRLLGRKPVILPTPKSELSVPDAVVEKPSETKSSPEIPVKGPVEAFYARDISDIKLRGESPVRLKIEGEDTGLVWVVAGDGRYEARLVDKSTQVKDLKLPQGTRLAVNEKVFITGGENVAIPKEILNALMGEEYVTRDTILNKDNSPNEGEGNDIQLQTKEWKYWEGDSREFEAPAGKARFVRSDGTGLNLPIEGAFNLLARLSGKQRIEVPSKKLALALLQKDARDKNPKVQEVRTRHEKALRGEYEGPIHQGSLSEPEKLFKLNLANKWIVLEEAKSDRDTAREFLAGENKRLWRCFR